MATIAPLNFTKDWTDPSDFPTTEPDEARARADMQELHNQTREYINNTLVPAIPTGVTNADQNMRGYRITEVGDPEEDSDAVNKEYVDRLGEELETKISNAGSKITLSSSVSSSSTTTAANSYAVKQAYDKGAAALSEAQSAKSVAQSAQSAASNCTTVTAGTLGPINHSDGWATLTIEWVKCGRIVNMSFTLVTEQNGGPSFYFSLGELSPYIEGITAAFDASSETISVGGTHVQNVRPHSVSVRSSGIFFDINLSGDETVTLKGSICYISKS